MKLDNRRTVLVGLAFLSICAFWQMCWRCSCCRFSAR